uniref:DNA/pantothenate metabolism flavoprotein C-terminal domain-containing protein n=1 Tax=Aegilops tauschii subsp. strangulata TaxID=200361 RepID=A0A453NW59_AEGTS
MLQCPGPAARNRERFSAAIMEPDLDWRAPALISAEPAQRCRVNQPTLSFKFCPLLSTSSSTHHSPRKSPTMLGAEDPESFFATAPPLRDADADAVRTKLQEFIARNSIISAGGVDRRPIVCVTSGGTTVPLEQRCIRYIDNFSSGHRGAASTEYILKAGYAVIFLHRR